ncbi:hypothetical protein [Aliiglaciecola litoralis]|uniref:Uncharacterized protein n=1 Tax=Aliiglaciecola litoralis TaxID=582857 RepID=A0ABN1LG12_9ALTE
MSCLTRKLQQKLTQFLKKRHDLVEDKSVENVKNELIGLGICPSHITDDQMREILRNANQS